VFGWFGYGLVGFGDGGSEIGRFVYCDSSANCGGHLVNTLLISYIVEIDPGCILH
jgi:hypothetical protein